jgi:hypothetical protein
MNVGFLIVLLFASIPFLFEFEMLGANPMTKLSFAEVLRLRNFRGQRWAWGFGILLIMITLLAAAPSASGKSYSVGIGMLLVVALSQLCIWVLVYVRVRRARAAPRDCRRDAA